MATEKLVETRWGAINAVDSGGSNFPIVLLHGSASSSAAFGRQLSSPLAMQFRLIAVDLPGHGKSDDAREPSADYSIRGLAATIADVLLQLEVERAVVVGWSLGGHIAIELMSNSNFVAGLMLAGTPPVTPGPMGLLRGFQLSTDMLLVSKPHYSQGDAARMVRLCFGDDAPVDALAMAARADGRLRTAVSKSFLYGNGMSDQRRLIQAATVPVAFVEGEMDGFIRLGYASSLYIPTLWDRKILDRAGHAAFWDNPQTFNAILQRFAFEIAIGSTDQSLSKVAETPQRRAAG